MNSYGLKCFLRSGESMKTADMEEGNNIRAIDFQLVV